ncbi:MAG: formimidoylglutamate deiminase [Paracoccaceae bacterium]
MTVIAAKRALMPEGWKTDIVIRVEDGRIADVEAQATPDTHVETLLPAPANLHSHAFQRAMAGLTERRGPDASDSFWTWRQLMFRFLDRLTPADVRAIAAQVQMEMLEAGYAAVGEFHYLHHQPGGVPYNDPAEMSAQICAAAEDSGIGLTLLPVLYQTGGLDGRGLGAGQVRFGSDHDLFGRMLERGATQIAALSPDANMGVAPHSLRAVPAGALAEISGAVDGPVHLHLAEQVAEVEEVQAAYGARPVEWLIDKMPVDGRWCLIHCTHMEPHETKGLAATGAVAGLCPITEASLGDGIFDGVRWLEAGGRIGVGSDSNIRISLSEELRQLEYSQRLRDRARAVLADPNRSTARRLFDEVCAGGAQATQRNSGQIATGAWADLVALHGDHADLIGREGDVFLDTWVFARDDALVSDVWAAGRHMVQDGQHIRRDQIEAGYRAVMMRLRDAL